MDYTSSGGGSDNIDWNTDDDLEIENYSLSSSSNFTPTGGESIAACSGSNEASSSAGASNSTLINHFVGMGFNETMVIKAIENNGEENSDAILESLLTYSVLESPPQLQQQPDDSDHCSEYDESFLDDLSDAENWPENEEMKNPLSDKEKKMVSLAEMGFPIEEASIAMDRCDPDTSIEELANFICAAQIARETDVHLGVDHDEKPTRNQLFTAYGTSKKRKHLNELKKNRQFEKRLTAEDEQMICLPRPMIGFGVPSETPHVVHRTIPEEAMGPPYFYYENVALAPKGVWSTISRFLYEIEPEFVDSKYFCANARKRGYIHNLPIHSRFPLLPLPPDTIHKALPLTKKWWPKWDTRTKLNCIQTVHGSARMTDRIRKALDEWNDEDEPPLSVQKNVLNECRKWNLVWVGKNKVAPLEADEVEMLLGFPRNHTRGISRTDRFKSLGNSFQVDTVAYHLSVLKDMFPRGINMLSLFSGIGGAEVALHRLGVPLKNVVSVEKSEVNRNVVRSWWEQTNQRGRLIDLDDVQQLDESTLERMIKSFGGFDFIVGGSPCNNLAGSNRVSRDGLEGKESALFYHYFRILDSVKRIMSSRNR